MDTPELSQLRSHVYQKSSQYHRAWAAYWHARKLQSPAALRKQRLIDCHALAVQLDTALTALIQHLQPHQSTERLTQELERTIRIQDILHREMAIADELEEQSHE